MTEYEAGDDVMLRLHIVPDGGVPVDGTTAATVVVTGDTGPARTPTAVPAATGRDRWSAPLPAVAAGAWRVVWTVTGTGSGVQSYELLIGPGPAAGGRVYATTGQLATHLGSAPPTGARRILLRASAKVDDLLRCARYATDTAGLPTDLALAAVLAEATCAQVEWWGEIGDTDGTGSASALAGAQIGTVKMPGAADGGIEYAPAAVSALRRAGLFSQGPDTHRRGYLSQGFFETYQ